MKPIKTKDTNVEFAKDQKEYNTLPAYIDKNGAVVTVWQMTDEELEEVIASKKIYLVQQTFNQPLQPLQMWVVNPVLQFTPNKQTRLHLSESKKGRGNCYATAISCIIGTEPDEVIQIQEYYDDENWHEILDNWLKENGWEQIQIDGHLKGDEIYLVIGESPRDEKITHICLYRDGEILHDPHPSNDGIKSTLKFLKLKRL